MEDPDKICLNDAGAWPSEQVESSPNHCFIFWGVGQRSYVDLMVKLIQDPSISLMSLQISLLFSVLSQLVH